MILRIRYQIMATPSAQSAPRFSTATIVAFVGAIFAILRPFLEGLGVWIQHHSAVQFSDDYLSVVQGAIVTIATTLAVVWHQGSPVEPPTEG